jgi:hypothetical protein
MRACLWVAPAFVHLNTPSIMNFVRITYTGRKIYRDRATGHIWQPEEERLVSEAIAKPLLKFVEFKRRLTSAGGAAAATGPGANRHRRPEQGAC